MHDIDDCYQFTWTFGGFKFGWIKCLRSLVGLSRMDRVRNEEVRRRAGIERALASRAD